MDDFDDSVTDKQTELKAEALLASWGFSRGDSLELWSQALKTAQTRTMRAGELVSMLGIAPQDTVDRLLSGKPSNILSLEFLADKLDGVRGQLQQMLATMRGVPYIEAITDKDIHKYFNEDRDVRKKCDQMGAVLLQTPKGTPLLVFSDYAVLSNYSQEGRLERQQDPIRIALGMEPACGIGHSGKILVAGNKGSDRNTALAVNISSQDNYWSSSLARSEGERTITRILENALDRRATDIDIDPHRDGTASVRFRVFGDMSYPDRHDRLTPELTKEITRFLISKSRAGDGGRLRAVADGQILFKSHSCEVFLRCSFIPVDRSGLDFDMISVSVRLLPRLSKAVRLDTLRLPHLAVEEIKKAVVRSQGLVIVSGPTNSGKSTTIAGIVSEHVSMFGSRRKRISIEDPVERYIDGISQVEVQSDNFAMIMRQTLRHDPDLIWVGEIRDAVSASTCVRAATSGHIVLSTVHANDSILSFRAIANYFRKEGEGKAGAAASQFDLAESLSLIISQRLSKNLCPKCKVPVVDLIPRAELDGAFRVLKEYLFREGFDTFSDRVDNIRKGFGAHPDGCPECQHTGYAGEIPVCEILPVTRSVKDIFSSSDNMGAYPELMKHRTITLFESALALYEKGEIELESLFI